MRVLVIGGGGREHALCWALAASPLTTELYCAPGNAGIAREAVRVDFKADDIDAAVHFARQQRIDLAVIGPEAPLVAGMTDALQKLGVKVFGPTQEAARLEGSKGFMKDLCARHGIPTGAYRRFTDSQAARAYVRELGVPLVVKADGLASGKGVTVCNNHADADEAIDALLDEGILGEAGSEIVIEEALSGHEVSAMALVDGETALMLPSALDYKRAHDGDDGPNTGGMGAISPNPWLDEATEERIRREIIQPTVDAMKAEGRPFVGLLYAGVMLTDDGPQVLEFNVRFGDPEAQVLMMRLMSDLLPALVAACDGVLSTFDLRWFTETAITVVMAAQGYPWRYKKGEAIAGLQSLSGDQDVMVFHSGTAVGEDGHTVSAGGRVLSVTALGNSVSEARSRVYSAIEQIDWPGGFYRRDIGSEAVAPQPMRSAD
ncbi:phosphoribosylamine--glycine ligase [Limimonas halophila]|uniref:Phosphoribosylamine--glycine ligase n=1 Tax=Limimonas halophila TaxID=1082479 RepID=A0A1G7UQT6_9PROT|nr:phosphoribosylamine--glycine ligase [Limimonas halophila]SDG49847.1 phosphoribosylamine--glycine ligase [Limimonas halophila]